MGEAKPHPPTRKRILDARRKGEVLKSSHFTQGILVVTAGLLLSLAGRFGWVRGGMLLEYTLSSGWSDPLAVFRLWGEFVFRGSAVFLLVLGGVAAAIELLQSGAFLVFDLAAPRFSRLDPLSGLRRIATTCRQSPRLLLYLMLLIGAAAGSLAVSGDEFLSAALATDETKEALLQEIVSRVAATMIGAALIVGIIDFFLRRRDHLRDLSMSHRELRDELKQDEGDPILRATRKALHHAVLLEKLAERVRRSKCIIVERRTP